MSQISHDGISVSGRAITTPRSTIPSELDPQRKALSDLMTSELVIENGFDILER